MEAHQYTDQYKLCLLIDGMVRKVSVAKGLFGSPYFIGDVNAMLMDTPVYDVIIGNVAGSRNTRGLCLCGRMVKTLNTRSVRYRYVTHRSSTLEISNVLLKYVRRICNVYRYFGVCQDD